jgi:hypothetical protein
MPPQTLPGGAVGANHRRKNKVKKKILREEARDFCSKISLQFFSQNILISSMLCCALVILTIREAKVGEF